jgi:phosphoribosyl 1,2-cyclic phosphodiesterase
MMKIKFWGVRGSIPCPGQNTVKYGGNTPCIELRFSDPERLIIIDAGSGIRELGNFMMGNDLPKGPISTEIFLSHTHWDHIMGFPFFVPAYIPGTKLKIYGPVNHDETLENIVGGQMTFRYFPVRETELASEIEYIHLQEGTYDLGDGISLTTIRLNHPIPCLGYKFEYQGKSFCTAYDTEPYSNIFCTDPEDPSYDEDMAREGDEVAAEQNTLLQNFFSNVDILIHDTQYTAEEYETKMGWGHSSFEHAIKTANEANVKKMLLFHHDPMRSDAQIDELAKDFCEPGRYKTEILFAKEGMTIEL